MNSFGGIGIVLFFVAGLVELVGIIMLLIGVDESRMAEFKERGKKKKERGLQLMMGGAIGLLISFALCTA